MGGLAFFLSAALITVFSYGVTEALQIRRRNQRRLFIEGRAIEADHLFQAGISGVTPVPLNFTRAFRLAVGRALGVDGERLRADDRMIRDLRVLNFDAIELASLLERSFDVRVRVVDVVRARTLRELCLLMFERSQNVSEVDPPLHRDPVPRVAEPEVKPHETA